MPKLNLCVLKCIKINSNNSKNVLLLYKDKFPGLSHMRVSDEIINVLYVDRKTDEPVGYFSVDKDRKMILAIDVSKKYRSRKIGTQLLKKAIENKGYNLTVRKTNKIAINMYMKNGFKIYDENPYQYIMKIPNR